MDYAHDFIADAVGANKENPLHQVAIFYTMLTIGGWMFYLGTAGVSFLWTFVRRADGFFPPTISKSELRSQVLQEIWIATASIPFMSIFMLPGPLFAYRGYSKMYKSIDEYGIPYAIFSAVLFLLFTDCVIYWFHRGLHHPAIYKYIHKAHHTYKFTTPFSSHAFHPLDGFTQGIPYYVFAYLVPIHNIIFTVMFMAVNAWTVSIHDQVDLGNKVALSTGHHTIHHEKFNYNYGQYTTTWDRIGGTYKPAEQTHTLAQFLGFEAVAVAKSKTPCQSPVTAHVETVIEKATPLQASATKRKR